MVRYSIDEDPRPAVYFWLAALSLAASFGLGALNESLSGKVLAPSAFALFLILVTAFDKYLWKLPPIQFLWHIPDLGAAYAGTVERINPETGRRELLAVEARITQTWTKIDVCVESARTISSVTTCGMFLANNDEVTLKYTYRARDKMPAPLSNEFGEGTQELRVSVGSPGTLTGSYYSTKHRGGSATFMKKK